MKLGCTLTVLGIILATLWVVYVYNGYALTDPEYWFIWHLWTERIIIQLVSLAIIVPILFFGIRRIRKTMKTHK